MDVNLAGTFHVTRAALPHLEAAAGARDRGGEGGSGSDSNAGSENERGGEAGAEAYCPTGTPVLSKSTMLTS